ncbi:hypothetical protein SISSUDRAFT_1036957 [Sistotremastrum suecicum HHB10207 ss-3]|uniref:Uncharacterized protein n=1 Tax=Sistotremastrum suecicum HHB10207 ss-3 TaxID=1314776 RepID=A0A165YSF8_9AGAM|nr:hypothetical protein SISSUDRAFT_1036957 [Sistotremastrum suecicum HHB10207 ss-3]
MDRRYMDPRPPSYSVAASQAQSSRRPLPKPLLTRASASPFPPNNFNGAAPSSPLPFPASSTLSDLIPTPYPFEIDPPSRPSRSLPILQNDEDLADELKRALEELKLKFSQAQDRLDTYQASNRKVLEAMTSLLPVFEGLSGSPLSTSGEMSICHERRSSSSSSLGEPHSSRFGCTCSQYQKLHLEIQKVEKRVDVLIARSASLEPSEASAVPITLLDSKIFWSIIIVTLSFHLPFEFPRVLIDLVMLISSSGRHPS